MKDLKIILLEKLHINKDTSIEKIKDIFSEEELNYKFSNLSLYSNSKSIKDIINEKEKIYSKSPIESAKQLKNEIKIDKFLKDHNFSRGTKRNIKLGKSNSELYHITSVINYKGYCIVFDPCDDVTTHDYSFLVTKTVSKVGKTLTPIEFVEPEKNSKEIHDIWDDCYPEYKNINRKYFDDIEDAWSYIEGKYGRF